MSAKEDQRSFLEKILKESTDIKGDRDDTSESDEDEVALQQLMRKDMALHEVTGGGMGTYDEGK